jgi:hypothetical protein
MPLTLQRLAITVKLPNTHPAAEADILSAELRCINMQAGQPHVELTGGPTERPTPRRSL